MGVKISTSQKIGRWICIFLVLIIFIFWKENIGDGMKVLGEGFILLIEKIYGFFEEKIFPIVPFHDSSKFEQFLKIPKVSEDPFLQVIFSILYFICIFIFGFTLAIFAIIFFIFCGLSFLLFWIIKGIGWCINDGLTEIRIYSPTGYIFSLFVLSYITGRLFHSIIFPRLCQWGETILALSLGKFFYELRRERRCRKLEEIEKGYIEKKEKIEDLRSALIKLTKEISPELLGFIPTETFEYKSWLEELFKRVKIKQQEKTAQAVSAYLDALREVWGKWGSIYEAIAKYELSVYKLLNLSKEIAIEEAIRDKKKRAELERIDLEEKVERLKIEKEIVQLEREIGRIKSLPSADGDKYIQETKNTIHKLIAKGAGIKMLSEEGKKQLSDPELQKNEKIYEQVKNMWEDAIGDLLERK